MKDTGFSVDGQSRRPTVYLAAEIHGEIAVEDGPRRVLEPAADQAIDD